MNYQTVFKGLIIIFLMIIVTSCSNRVQVSEEDIIGKFSVTSNNDLITKDLDLIFLLESAGKLTELDFFESKLLKCTVEGDPMGTGINYGFSSDSIKWKLEGDEITFIIPNENDKTKQSEIIKKALIYKQENNIIIETNNVVYTLKKE